MKVTLEKGKGYVLFMPSYGLPSQDESVAERVGKVLGVKIVEFFSHNNISCFSFVEVK